MVAPPTEGSDEHRARSVDICAHVDYINGLRR